MNPLLLWSSALLVVVLGLRCLRRRPRGRWVQAPAAQTRVPYRPTHSPAAARVAALPAGSPQPAAGGAVPQAVATPAAESCVMTYRTGESEFRFSLERVGETGYRIYIANQPGYGTRGTDVHTIHRLHDGRRYYICWAGEIATESQARAVAALWADGTQQYIKYGYGF